MTGAPIPEGADAVVPIEQTELVDDATVRLQQVDPPPGQHILPLGASLRVGDVVLHAGRRRCGRSKSRSWPKSATAWSTCDRGRAWPFCRPATSWCRSARRRPPDRFATATGRCSSAAAARAGAEAIELGIARDDRDELRRWIEQGLAADVLRAQRRRVGRQVRSGARACWPSWASSKCFTRLRCGPASRCGSASKHDGERRVLVFGLPGNPVSSFVCFELFVRPAIAALAGRGFRRLVDRHRAT